MTDPPTAPLRIVIADDQASVREGLVLLLGLLPNIEVVGSAANGQLALDLVGDCHPDAILLDLHMPVLDGVDTTRRLVADYPEVAIVVLTTYSDDASVLAALRAGARGYLTKDADRSEIAQALHAAVRGLTVLDPAVYVAVLAATNPTETPIPAAAVPLHIELPDGLTRREAEVLVLIAKGASNRDIAAALALSTHTVKSHINRIFSKTRSLDRASATHYARRHGLIP